MHYWPEWQSLARMHDYGSIAQSLSEKVSLGRRDSAPPNSRGKSGTIAERARRFLGARRRRHEVTWIFGHRVANIRVLREEFGQFRMLFKVAVAVD